MILPKNKNIGITSIFNEDYTKVKDTVYTNHEGVNYRCPIGSELITKRTCKVVSIFYGNNGYGKFLVLQSCGNKKFFYLAAHLSEFECKNGDVIPIGQVVALSGNTGGKTGIITPHLHTGTYKVESKQLWNKEGTGFYYGEYWFIN